MAKFQGRGKVNLHDVVAGVPGLGVFVGCADELPVNLSVDTFEHIERCTGNDSTDFTGTKKKTAKGSLRLTEITPANLALGLNGLIVPAGSPDTVTDEELPAGIAVGSMVMLGGVTPHGNITSLVLTDAGSPGGVLEEDTDYTLNAKTGTVEFLTAPDGAVHAAYGFTDGEYVSIFTAPQAEKWLRFNFLNKADSNKKGVVDLYRCRFSPTSGLPLITDELLSMDLSFDVLIDQTKPDDGELGQFGRFTTPS